MELVTDDIAATIRSCAADPEMQHETRCTDARLRTSPHHYYRVGT
jgi:hypothetical protein